VAQLGFELQRSRSRRLRPIHQHICSRAQITMRHSQPSHHSSRLTKKGKRRCRRRGHGPDGCRQQAECTASGIRGFRLEPRVCAQIAVFTNRAKAPAAEAGPRLAASQGVIGHWKAAIRSGPNGLQLLGVTRLRHAPFLQHGPFQAGGWIEAAHHHDGYGARKGWQSVTTDLRSGASRTVSAAPGFFAV